MFKAIIAALFGATLFSGVAAAQSTCASYPYPNPLTDGTPADGGQVYANFTAIQNCANTLAPLASPHFTGNVGIGTTSPVGPLDVYTNINTVARNLFVRNTSSGSSAYSLMQLGNDVNATAIDFGVLSSGNTTYGGPSSGLLQANSGAFVFGTSGSYPIQFITGAAERMRITSAGDVGIGTALPVSVLQVRETTNQNVTFFANDDGGWVGAAGIQSVNDANSLAEPLGFYASQYDFGGGGVGLNTTSLSGYAFLVSGPAGGTTNWTNISDARLKKNVTEISDALSLVKRLRGVRYDWLPANEREVGKDLDLPPDEKQIGFIAQEVAAVVPEAVVPPKTETKYRDKGGKETTVKLSNSLYGLKEAALVPVLVEAIKEQQAEIETLKSEVAALKSDKPSAH